MISIVIKFIMSLILGIAGILIIQNITGTKIKFFSIKIVIHLVIFSVVSAFLHDPKYNIIYPIITYVVSVLIYSDIFNTPIAKSYILSGIMFITIALSDFLLSLILLSFVELAGARTDWIFMVLANFFVSLFAYLISSIKVYKTVFSKLSEKFDYNNEKSTYIFISISIVALLISFIGIVNNSFTFDEFIIDIISCIIVFILFAVFFGEKNKYKVLNSQYEVLYKYNTTIENWLENEHVSYHEYKNQLAYIRSIIKEKAAIKYIDSILKESIDNDPTIERQIRNVPKGGMKGLLFYKIMQAKKSEIKIDIDVSDSTREILAHTDTNKSKIICRIIGILFDNAIEAAAESQKKQISIELYLLDSNLIFVIMNTFSGNINTNKVFEKGFTTKGSGHGNGLNYAKSLIKKNNYLNLTSTIINSYFTQKLIIHLEGNKKSY